ncbi:RNA-directed DNA polymerase, eukaryota [Tanacetum coccineum]
MSIFKTPIAVIKELEVIRNKFFLGADADANKMTWIKWNKVMASKKDGGLGIGSLYGFNRALLFKWKWRFMSYPSAFWVLSLNFFLVIMVECMLISDGLLKDLYPRVYNLDLDPESVVANRLDLAPKAPFLRRNPRGGAKKEQRVTLLSFLETRVSSNQRDRWIWTGDGDGIYSAKCGRKLIDKWTLCLDTYATRGITVRSDKCGICDTNDETINHLMLHCDLAWDVWALVGRWWSLDFPSVLTIRELLSWVDDTRLHTLAKVLHVVVGTTAWSIWNFRNQNVFQEEKPKKALLFDSIVSTSFFWLSNRNNKFRINWIGFLQDPIMTCNTL